MLVLVLIGMAYEIKNYIPAEHCYNAKSDPITPTDPLYKLIHTWTSLGPNNIYIYSADYGGKDEQT